MPMFASHWNILVSLRVCYRVLAILLAMANSAVASPPRYVDVNDIPVAVNATHLFLLRTLSDNRGSNSTRATTRFLISQNLGSGVVENHWKLGETVEQTWDGCVAECRFGGPNLKMNPQIILQKYQTVPFELWPLIQWPDESKYGRVFDEYYLAKKGIMRYRGENAQVQLSTMDVIKRIHASLDETMNLMPDDDNPVGPAHFDKFAFDTNLENCLLQTWNANLQKFSVYSLYCEDGDAPLINRYNIYFTLLDGG